MTIQLTKIHGGYLAHWRPNGKPIGEILAGDDGYYAWWPALDSGCLTQGFIQEMNICLRRLNKRWAAEVRRHLRETTEES